MQTQTTIEGSHAHYWIMGAGTGVWRTARKPQVCRTGRERHIIKPGDRYLDTGERTPDGVWATVKCCEACANEPCDFAPAKEPKHGREDNSAQKTKGQP